MLTMDSPLIHGPWHATTNSNSAALDQERKRCQTKRAPLNGEPQALSLSRPPGSPRRRRAPPRPLSYAAATGPPDDSPRTEPEHLRSNVPPSSPGGCCSATQPSSPRQGAGAMIATSSKPGRQSQEPPESRHTVRAEDWRTPPGTPSCFHKMRALLPPTRRLQQQLPELLLPASSSWEAPLLPLARLASPMRHPAHGFPGLAPSSPLSLSLSWDLCSYLLVQPLHHGLDNRCLQSIFRTLLTGIGSGILQKLVQNATCLRRILLWSVG